MGQNKHLCTSTAKVGHHPLFRPHGQIEFHLERNIMVATAVGPFNTEIIEAVSKAQQGLFSELVTQDKWAFLAHFKESVLASREVTQALSAYLQNLAGVRVPPIAAAYVIAPDLEGAKVMIPHAQRAYAGVNIHFSVFATLEEAQTWLERCLAG